MNSVDLVKKSLLHKKAIKYFKENPKAKSVIVEIKTGGIKTIWRVTKENKDFRIVEVSTKKSEFLIEAEDEKTGASGKHQEYSPMGLDKEKAKALKNKNLKAYQLTKGGFVGKPSAGPSPAKQLQPMPGQPGWPVPMGDETGKEDTKKLPQSGIPQDLANFSKWNPSGVGNEFEKELVKTKSFKKALQAMPDELFVKTFRNFGLNTKKDLDTNPEAYQKAKDFFAQHNPRIAGMKESAVVKEITASPDFTNMMKIAGDAMSSYDHNQMSMASKKIDLALPKITDPKEKQQLGAVKGLLTTLIDQTTGGNVVKKGIIGQPSRSTGIAQITASKKVSGRVIKEEEAPKPQEEDETDVGLDKDTKPIEDEEEKTTKEQTQEEMMIGKSLTGQTIRSAGIELSPDGGKLTLDLVSVAAPVSLEWKNNGKVVYLFKSRPFVLRRK